MMRLYSASNLPEAHLLLHRLVRAGIEACVLNEHAQGGLGEIPFTHAYPEIWIMEEADEGRARAIIAEFERAPVIQVATYCKSCGESNPPEFEICWHCGKPLD
ncbi:MAG TPA: DUF2007 domain-containing protein [Sulfuricaulis sp.]|jgi:hypothetical protein|nr:DUF2007 domain-containing protein [Sulfuricaulis sp.]